ncbi:MAG: Arsenate reductase [Synergistales bacterium 53_16]|jgi:arsenate reductase|nr:MAG: Arsenate reductase [Synergistales bacterium 53_16]HAG22885.1 low molecular weight phosphatase family protein [Synergistaceae bacterium]
MPVRQDKIKVLFVCGKNTARSQMGEALLKFLGGDRFEVESAGLEAGEAINPLVIDVMKEIGIDISRNATKKVFDLYKAGRIYNYVIAVCDAVQAERCPIFPGVRKQIHWPLPDPASFTGSWEEKLQKTREVRDQMKAKIEEWIKTPENLI